MYNVPEEINSQCETGSAICHFNNFERYIYAECRI